MTTRRSASNVKVLHSGYTFTGRKIFPSGILPTKCQVLERIIQFENFRTVDVANDVAKEIHDRCSDGIQGVRTGSREPVLAMPGYSANPFLLFVIDLLIHAAILSAPVLTFCNSSYNLFETVAYPRRIEN